MKISRTVTLGLMCAALSGCGVPADAPRSAPASGGGLPEPAAAEDRISYVLEPAFRGNPWGEPVRAPLIKHCGSCHLPDLDTSNPGALAAFDLSEPEWNGGMTSEQTLELETRFRATEGVTDAETAIVAAFVACAVFAECDPGAAEAPGTPAQAESGRATP